MRSAAAIDAEIEKLDRWTGDRRDALRLESRRDEAWQAFDQASRELERQKEAMLDDIGRRLAARIEREPLFTIRWHLA
jgi:hypothetical protein